MISKYFNQKNIFFLVMAIIALIFIASVADIALMFFASFVISCTLIPIVDKLDKYIPRALAVTLVLLIVIVSTALIFIPLAIFTLEQAHALFENLPHHLTQIGSLLKFKFMGFTLSDFLNPDTLNNYTRTASSGILTFTINLTKSLATSATGVVAIIIMVFYICYDTEHIKTAFLKLFPPRFKGKAASILDTITHKVGGYVLGQLIAMLFVGIVAAIGLALIGNKHALTLGFITFVLEIIPVIGPSIAIAICLFTAASHGFWYVILTFIVCFGAQVIQNQLLRPVLLGKLMDMHPLVIIISLMIGAKFLGVWGVILAPAIASVICVLVDELYLKTINEG